LRWGEIITSFSGVIVAEALAVEAKAVAKKLADNVAR
jgi:hypothetical protein